MFSNIFTNLLNYKSTKNNNTPNFFHSIKKSKTISSNNNINNNKLIDILVLNKSDETNLDNDKLDDNNMSDDDIIIETNDYNYIQNKLIIDYSNIVKNEVIPNIKIIKMIEIQNTNSFDDQNIFVDIPIPIKNNSSNDESIPLNIFLTWRTKNLPHYMKQNYDLLVKTNPEFNIKLFDDNNCRDFIKNNFASYVLHAFDCLTPGAYKADLWRYCILYIYGGIYIDIKYKCINNFKLISLINKEHFVKDRDPYGGTYNALLILKPRNKIMLKCIINIVENIKNNYFGQSPLYPSGPNLLGKYFTRKQKNSWELKFNVINKIDSIIHFNIPILSIYNEYREESNQNLENINHYHNLWMNKKIYKRQNFLQKFPKY
jgi:mannosyltransferase OCH1-like enzyme